MASSTKNKLSNQIEQPSRNDPLRKKRVKYDVLLRITTQSKNIKYLQLGMGAQIIFLILLVAFIFEQDYVLERNSVETAARSMLSWTRFPEKPGSSEYKVFSEISNVEEYYQWVNNVVYPQLFYKPSFGNFSDVYEQNYLLFGFRFRQLRVIPNATCSFPSSRCLTGCGTGGELRVATALFAFQFCSSGKCEMSIPQLNPCEKFVNDGRLP